MTRAPLLLLAALALLAGCGGDAVLRLGVAASLRELVVDTAPAFEQAHGVALRPSFEASSAIARQIEAGAPLDAFLSADAENVERVRARLDAATVTRFLGNRLALVGRAGLAAAPSRLEELPAHPGRIALAGPAVPAGRYARARLASLGLLDALAARVVVADNVRAALALVEAGAADFAIVYATDARLSQHARLLWTAGDDEDGVAYVAAAVAGAPPAAAAYVRWLLGAEVQQRAAALGFTGPGR